ncbi:MAG: methyltransferase domain-containing protein [Myxococcota bacterium]
MTSSNEKLRAEWRTLAPEWIEKVGDEGDAARVMLDPWVQARCVEACGGSLDGRRVVDVGCGEGRFSRWLASKGAVVHGIDPCQPLIEEAQRRAGPNQTFSLAASEALPLADESVDLAVSYLSICDMPDLDAAMAEMSRALVSRGVAVICTLHPMITVPGSVGWIRNENGDKLYRKVDRYFDEGGLDCPLFSAVVTNFHRTLETHMESFARAGFVLVRLQEPRPGAATLEQHPQLGDELRVPDFILFVLQKHA